jgi:hypothetical protein
MGGQGCGLRFLRVTRSRCSLERVAQSLITNRARTPAPRRRTLASKYREMLLELES